MKLETYTFSWVPDKFTVPVKEKFNSHVLTYSNVAFFSWGTAIVGKIVELEWQWMSAEQFFNLQKLLEDDEAKTWDLEMHDRIWYINPVNHPFIVGRSITGLTSSASGEISDVDTINNNLKLINIIGDFEHGEPFQDSTIPAKTGDISAIEIIPNYTVELIDLKGEYFKNMQTYFVWRENVKLSMLITAEA